MGAQFPGQGVLKRVTGPDPAAGAEAVITVPSGKEWVVHYIEVPLVTDATVATRIVDWKVEDSGTDRKALLRGNQAGQAASLTRTHAIQDAETIERSVTDTETVLLSGDSLKHMGRLPAGATINTLTTALQAGDDFGVPEAQVEEYDAPRAV